MAVFTVSNEIYMNISLFGEIFAIIFGLLITCFHFKSLQSFLKKVKKRYRSSPSYVLSLALVLCTFIMPSIWIFKVIDPFHSMTFCYFHRFVMVNLYTFFKLIQSTILVVRVYESYKESPLAYDTKKLLVWMVFLTSWTIFNIIFGSFTSSTELDPADIPPCTTTVSNQFLASMVMLEIISGIGNCYLFIRPLYGLKGFGLPAELQYVAVKQMILAVITVLSSIMAIFCIALLPFAEVFCSSDIIISTVCIILMYKWNDKIFAKICCCCCNCVQRESKHDKNPEIENTVNSNETTTTSVATESTQSTQSNQSIKVIIH
eukprot:85463_1